MTVQSLCIINVLVIPLEGQEVSHDDDDNVNSQ